MSLYLYGRVRVAGKDVAYLVHQRRRLRLYIRPAGIKQQCPVHRKKHILGCEVYIYLMIQIFLTHIFLYLLGKLLAGLQLGLLQLLLKLRGSALVVAVLGVGIRVIVGFLVISLTLGGQTHRIEIRGKLIQLAHAVGYHNAVAYGITAGLKYTECLGKGINDLLILGRVHG